MFASIHDRVSVLVLPTAMHPHESCRIYKLPTSERAVCVLRLAFVRLCISLSCSKMPLTRFMWFHGVIANYFAPISQLCHPEPYIRSIALPMIWFGVRLALGSSGYQGKDAAQIIVKWLKEGVSTLV